MKSAVILLLLFPLPGRLWPNRTTFRHLGGTHRFGFNSPLIKLHPVLLLGGNIRLSETISVVSENWIITGQNRGLDEQPLGIALRFFGSRIAVDAGAIFVLEEGGFPFPWLSFVYNFSN